MGLLTGILGLPLAPVRGTVWVADQVRQAAEDQLYDPARIRAELEQVERMRETGELTEDEAEAYEDVLIDRLMAAGHRAQEG